MNMPPLLSTGPCCLLQGFFIPEVVAITESISGVVAKGFMRSKKSCGLLFDVFCLFLFMAG